MCNAAIDSQQANFPMTAFFKTCGVSNASIKIYSRTHVLYVSVEYFRALGIYFSNEMKISISMRQCTVALRYPALELEVYYLMQNLTKALQGTTSIHILFEGTRIRSICVY